MFGLVFLEKFEIAVTNGKYNLEGVFITLSLAYDREKNIDNSSRAKLSNKEVDNDFGKLRGELLEDGVNRRDQELERPPQALVDQELERPSLALVDQESKRPQLASGDNQEKRHAKLDKIVKDPFPRLLGQQSPKVWRCNVWPRRKRRD